MGGDPNRRHVEDSEAKAKGKAEAQADSETHVPAHQVAPGVTPDQAHRIIGSGLAAQPDMSPGISAPPTLDLGDRAVGTPANESFMLFNNAATDAYVRVDLEGSPALQLVEKPEVLFPSRQGVDPKSAVRIVFTPTAKGRIAGTLVVQARWANTERAPQELRIPVVGAAHEIGQPSIAEEEAEQTKRADKKHAQAEHDAWVAAGEKEADRQIDTGKLPGNDASRRQLDQAANTAQAALNRLLMNRRTGVGTARGEAANYAQAQPAYHESLLERLAWAALDIATANIAGKLGKRLEQALTSSFKIEEHLGPTGERVPETTQSPSKAVVAILTGSVTDTVKRGAKAGVDAVKPGEHANERGGDGHQGPAGKEALESDDPVLAFFARQEIALNGETSAHARSVTQQANYALEPLLDTNPRQAIKAMNAIADQIDEAANTQEAEQAQAQASAMQWIAYVGQSSLGTVKGDEATSRHMRVPESESPTTRMEATNVAPSGHGAPHTVAGLVNVEFTADIVDATKPVKVGQIKVNGVSNDVAHRLARASLRDSGLAIRAYGAPSSSNAVLGLTATRDEAGNVQYTDDTGAPGAVANWFARKIGEPHGGPDAQMRGARTLLEQEILAHQPQKSDIKTDDKDDKDKKK